MIPHAPIFVSPVRHAILILLTCACVLPVQAQETDPPRQAQTLNAG